MADYPSPPLFDDDFFKAQSPSTELVIYSPSVYQAVTIAWPCYQGIRVQPHQIKVWLRRNKVYWPCFCHVVLGEPLSSIIIEDGVSCIAKCHFAPSRCRFFIHLEEIYESATIVSPYQEFIAEAQLPLYHNELIRRFLFNDRVADTSLHAPYFYGFSGEWCSSPDMIQLSARIIGHVSESSIPSVATQSIPSSPTLVSDSDVSTDFTDSEEGDDADDERDERDEASIDVFDSSLPSLPILVNVGELNTLRRIAFGVGVTRRQWEELGTPCQSCGLLYVARMLRPHNSVCSACRM